MTLSMQQLFNGSLKRGGPSIPQAPMTQKQTKSKARMIRSILQTSTHLQTDTKRNQIN